MGTYARLPPLWPIGAAASGAAAECLERVGLGGVAARPYWELSGGQKQRVLIARALAAEPQVLFLDEPTAGVDREAETAIIALIAELNRERGMTVVLVSHHLGPHPVGGPLGRRRGRRAGRTAHARRRRHLARGRRPGVDAPGKRRMSTLSTILAADFLLRDALIGSVLVGMVCPLVGVYFILRRMIFLGVALPQVSAAGVAFSFMVYRLFVGPHDQIQVGERMLGLIGSGVFTMTTTLRPRHARARRPRAHRGAHRRDLRHRGRGHDPLPRQRPARRRRDRRPAQGRHPGHHQRQPERHAGGSSPSSLLALFVFRKELLLVSFDRDLAVVFGKRVVWWDIVLYLLIGAVISLGVMAAGPLATFGFLVIPPLTMRLVTRRMLTFSLGSSVLGGVVAFVGFYWRTATTCRWRRPRWPSPASCWWSSARAVGARRMAVRWRTA